MAHKAVNLEEVASEAVKKFKGNANTLESAIGSMYVAKAYGWKVIYLVHDKKTIRKYEQILNIDFRESFPEEGPQAQRSVAFEAVQKVSNFWKAVKGEIAGIRTPELKD
jgi:hypothetical protein